MQHIFIAEIDGKEIDMAAMMPEEKQKAVMEMTRKFVEDKRCFTRSQRHSA